MSSPTVCSNPALALHASPSALGGLYARLYASLCGSHPAVNPLHFQWLAVRHLRSDIERVLGGLEGPLLDVGCGSKPYRRWLAPDVEPVGLDIAPGPAVDHVVRPGERWPFPDRAFRSVLCTQVVEHAREAGRLLAEIRRVLAPDGTLILTMPFLYNRHGEPHDYWRSSVEGLQAALEPHFRIREAHGEGGAASTLAQLLLNWIDMSLNRTRPARLLKGLLLPAWLPFCLVVNIVAALADPLDRTGAFYANVWIVADRRR